MHCQGSSQFSLSTHTFIHEGNICCCLSSQRWLVPIYQPWRDERLSWPRACVCVLSDTTEENPRLQAVVSLLTTGPVGVGDRIGYTDVDLVYRCASFVLPVLMRFRFCIGFFHWFFGPVKCVRCRLLRSVIPGVCHLSHGFNGGPDFPRRFDVAFVKCLLPRFFSDRSPFEALCSRAVHCLSVLVTFFLCPVTLSWNCCDVEKKFISGVSVG